jgi:hypothetical protein
MAYSASGFYAVNLANIRHFIKQIYDIYVTYNNHILLF